MITNMKTIDKLLTVARSQIGVTESPPNSNNVKYNTEYYGREVYDGLWGCRFPWCCVFVWWVYKHADMPDLFYGGYKTANCGTLADYYKSHGQFYRTNLKVGDIVFFDFGVGRYGFDHVGIIERVNEDGTYTTIEGNTSSTSDDNGGAVMRRKRYPSQISGAGRPNYDEDDYMTKDEILTELGDKWIATYDDLPEWAKPDIRKMLDEGIINGGTSAAVDPDDINMFLSDIKNIIVCNRLINK